MAAMTTIHPEFYPGQEPSANHLHSSRLNRAVDAVVGVLDRTLDRFFDAANMPPSPHVVKLAPIESLPQPTVAEAALGESSE